MIRKILIGVAIAIVLILGYGSYFFFYATRQHSPLSNVEYSDEHINMTVTYSRPYKKGRKVFGPESEEALQPYGEYWRLGANAATKFTVSDAIYMHGNKLDAGEYAIYAIPDDSLWTIGVNTDWDRWGAVPPDRANDVVKFKIAPMPIDSITEQMTIRIIRDRIISLDIFWDDAYIQIPIKPDTVVVN